jgi:hypothetical protein
MTNFCEYGDELFESIKDVNFLNSSVTLKRLKEELVSWNQNDSVHFGAQIHEEDTH